MKKLIYTGGLIILIFFLQHCTKEETTGTTANIIISNITDGDAYKQGSLATISVDINDNASIDINKTSILIDDQEMYSSQVYPFEFVWNTAAAETGTHTIQLMSVDSDGKIYLVEIMVRVYIVNDKPCPCAPTVTDFDGNTYNTIQIGDQCWMKENLKAIHYADGTPLVDGTGAINTQYDTITKYYFNYNDDESYVETYGRLYIWMAAVNGYASEVDLNPSQIQGVCPDGWHLPSDSEWKELEMFLGMTEREANDREWRGTIEGGMLKETGTLHWDPPNMGATNESGFTALPAGHRNLTDDYYSLGKKGSFWTSTNHIAKTNTQNPAFRLLNADYERTYRYRGFHGYLTYARSVRCVKDE